jgi:hypothetical protein
MKERWFFEKINNINKSVSKLKKKKREMINIIELEMNQGMPQKNL